MEDKDEGRILQEMIEKHKPKSDYLASLNIRVGNNDHHEVVAAMKEFGKKVLFLTGTRAMRNYGFLDKYLKLFENQGFEVMHYDSISANPTLKQMEEGIDVAREFKPDFIFALGGGSVIDTAKVVSVGISGKPWDFVEKRAEISNAIPIVASSSTSGTGSHISAYAVATNTDTLEKKTLKHPLLLPKLSIADLDIVKHMPSSVIASTGFDVLCHAAEVYTRKDCTPEAEEFCTRALQLIREHLVASYNGDSLSNKVGMVYADIYAGIALNLVGTHVPHAISHPISARFPNVNHGQALADVFAETTKKMIEQGSPELNKKFEHISELLGGSSDFVRTILNYKKLLDFETPKRFSREECELIYLDTIGYRKPSVDRSPVGLTKSEVRDIIYTSLQKK